MNCHRFDIVQLYASIHLREYKSLFSLGLNDTASGQNGVASELEILGKRYQWMKRWIHKFSDVNGFNQYDLFPKEWKMDAAVTREFCHITA